ncbi:32772_t:CDS:2, partial [Gigaspora margarita]
LSSCCLKTASTFEYDYSSVQNWSPNEVNLFLKEKFAKDWKTLNQVGFEKHDVAGNELLGLKADDLYKAGLPFLQKKTFYIQAYDDKGEPSEINGIGLESIDDNSEAPKVIRFLRHIRPNQYYRIRTTKETFYIQAYNDEGEPSERFEKFTMHNEDDFRGFLKAIDGKGLESIDDNSETPNVISSLRHIRSNQHYRINASHLTAVKKGVTWSKVEYQAMEEETLLAVQNALIEKINGPTKIFPKRVMYDQEGKPLMEWDGILKHINNLVSRLKEFPKKLEATSDLEFKQLLRKQYIGVACGAKFPEDVRHNARDMLGLMVVFPGGGRYNVEMPKKL